MSLREGPGTAHMEMPVACPIPLPHGVENMLSIDRRHSPSEHTCYSARSLQVAIFTQASSLHMEDVQQKIMLS